MNSYRYTGRDAFREPSDNTVDDFQNAPELRAGVAAPLKQAVHVIALVKRMAQLSALDFEEETKLDDDDDCTLHDAMIQAEAALDTAGRVVQSAMEALRQFGGGVGHGATVRLADAELAAIEPLVAPLRNRTYCETALVVKAALRLLMQQQDPVAALCRLLPENEFLDRAYATPGKREQGR